MCKCRCSRRLCTPRGRLAVLLQRWADGHHEMPVIGDGYVYGRVTLLKIGYVKSQSQADC
jgi:hypothetical protein